VGDRLSIFLIPVLLSHVPFTVILLHALPFKENIFPRLGLSVPARSEPPRTTVSLFSLGADSGPTRQRSANQCVLRFTTPGGNASTSWPSCAGLRAWVRYDPTHHRSSASLPNTSCLPLPRPFCDPLLTFQLLLRIRSYISTLGVD
jgi:hypothetical protein